MGAIIKDTVLFHFEKNNNKAIPKDKTEEHICKRESSKLPTFM